MADKRWTARDHAEARMDIKRGRVWKERGQDWDALIRWCETISRNYAQAMHWIIFGYWKDQDGRRAKGGERGV